MSLSYLSSARRIKGTQVNVLMEESKQFIKGFALLPLLRLCCTGSYLGIIVFMLLVRTLGP